MAGEYTPLSVDASSASASDLTSSLVYAGLNGCNQH